MITCISLLVVAVWFLIYTDDYLVISLLLVAVWFLIYTDDYLVISLLVVAVWFLKSTQSGFLTLGVSSSRMHPSWSWIYYMLIYTILNILFYIVFYFVFLFSAMFSSNYHLSPMLFKFGAICLHMDRCKDLSV